MRAYATVTGTRRNLRVMLAHGWRLIFTPDSSSSNIRTVLGMGFRYAVDNGAWGSHSRGEAWEGGPFLDTLQAYGADADWVVLPDIVEGGLESLARSTEWAAPVLEVAKEALIPVQDGMAPWDVAPLLATDNRLGIFVGGSTEWKLASMPWWGRIARRYGRTMHVGRVNSIRRIQACLSAGADSFDGTSVTRYAKNINVLDTPRRQATMWETLDQWDATA